jgi:hypothetical protein
MEFDDSQPLISPGHYACSNDLEDTVGSEGNLGKEEGVMVRMFKRLLRGGTKQRVAGAWVF